jgi:hypothetical protein
LTLYLVSVKITVMNVSTSTGSPRSLSGHPMLAKAAVVAVREWRYRPTLQSVPAQSKPAAPFSFVFGHGLPRKRRPRPDNRTATLHRA